MITRVEERGHDFRLQNHVISIEGISGGMVSSVYQYLIDIKLFQPEVIFLQIGSNDISNRSEKVENVLLAVISQYQNYPLSRYIPSELILS
jgi:lysophospholipase L1-like esterase